MLSRALAGPTLAVSAIAVLLFIGPAVAELHGVVAATDDGEAVEALTVGEMKDVRGSDGSVPHAYCDLEWWYYGTGGATGQCFLNGEYCAHKREILKYRICVQAMNSPLPCDYWTKESFYADKHEKYGGGCNGGDPEQECQGDWVGYWYIGDLKDACEYQYVPPGQ